MDAIFFPAPADVALIDDARGGMITRETRVLVNHELATIPAAHLDHLLATTFNRVNHPLQGANSTEPTTIYFERDPDLAREHVTVIATEANIVIRANGLPGFWRGTQLVIQMIGPDLLTGLPSAVNQLPYLPLEIQDFPSNPNRRMSLPLLHLAQDIDDAHRVVIELAALGVNQLVLLPPDAMPGELLPLPHGISVEEFDGFLTRAAQLGMTVLPDHSGVTVGDLTETAISPYPRAAIEQSLWPNAAASLNQAWIGERATQAGNSKGADLDVNQRIGKYALLWSAQAIDYEEWAQSEWPWHLARIAPQPSKNDQTLVGLLLAPGTHAHGDHVEMRRGLEGVIGGGLKITAMVNGEAVPVALTPGHPLHDHPTAGVYQVTIPALAPGDDLRLAAIAKTDDGCSC